MSAVLNISIDLASPNLTDQDRAIIAALGLTPGGDWPPAQVINVKAPATFPPAPALKAGEVVVPAAETKEELREKLDEVNTEEKPAPKPRRSRAKKAAETEEAPPTGGPAALEDLPVVTRSEAIEWAIKLSDKGLKAELRGVLDSVEARRASELTDGDQAAKFIMLTKQVLASQPAEKATPEAEDAPAEEAPAEEAPAEEAPAEEAPAGRTLQDAIDAAMALVKDNKGAVVRAAVQKLGVAKVSAMTEDQVPEFFRLIEG